MGRIARVMDTVRAALLDPPKDLKLSDGQGLTLSHWSIFYRFVGTGFLQPEMACGMIVVSLPMGSQHDRQRSDLLAATG
jgi:hypothetical protein